MKKYVAIRAPGGNVIAVGQFEGYVGKWISVKRNDNETIAVNSDMALSIHFYDLPTRGILNEMAKSTPVIESANQAVEIEPQIATKTSSDKLSAEDMFQLMVDGGPPGMTFTGADISQMPSSVKLPKGVTKKAMVEHLVRLDKERMESEADDSE
jgi:hypothetical protein